MSVLGIETSCDETAVAIYCGDRGLQAHAVHSQVAVHAEFGGVVPELASRDHVRKVIPLIQRVLRDAKCTPSSITGVAFTVGPGLIGALLVGTAIGRSLAFAWGLPCIGVHHMEGHLLAPMLEPDPPRFPFLALLVSGGHTQLVLVRDVGEYTLLGESLDDAVGEAFDKTATLLGLGYPGGALLAKLAERGDPKRFRFPRPMTDRPGLDFSFSGLKTYAMNTLRKQEPDEQILADVARAFEDAVVETLVIKCRRAFRQTSIQRLIVSGGVGANRRLRAAIAELGSQEGARTYFPRVEFCTDNAAMVAYAGYQRLRAGEHDPLAFTARPRWPLEDLHKP